MQDRASGCAALGSRQEVMLPGYGVEAALKNMEYSAMDDKSKAKAKLDSGEQGWMPVAGEA